MQSTSSLPESPESPEYITVIDRGISYTLNKKEDEAQQYAVIAMLKKQQQQLQFSTNGWSSAYKIVWEPQPLPRWFAQIIGVTPNSTLTPEFVKTQNEQQIFYIPDPIVELPSVPSEDMRKKRIDGIMKANADRRANKGKPPKPGSIKRGGRRTKHIRNKHNKTKSRRG